MSKLHLSLLGRDEYLASIASITDEKTLLFADQSLAWWDRHASWKVNRCAVLCDEKGNHLCYLFSRIDRYSEYLTLYNLFTPSIRRRKGYATQLLRLILADAVNKHVRRITFSSVSSSLDFYMSFGFIYWGINDIGDYYCNLPLPKTGLDGISAMTEDSEPSELIGSYADFIHIKVDDNEKYLSLEKKAKHQTNKIRLGKHYAKEEFDNL